MLEAIMLSALAFWLLAASTHRFRRETGVTRPAERHVLRSGGILLLVAAAACCASPLVGEWCVRFLAAVSVAGIAMVLALSARSSAILAPLRGAIAATRR